MTPPDEESPPPANDPPPEKVEVPTPVTPKAVVEALVESKAWRIAPPEETVSPFDEESPTA